MKRTILTAWLAIAIAGCTRAEQILIPTIEATQRTATLAPSSIPAATPSLTLEPTLTDTPSATQTPHPDIAFLDEPAGNSYLVPLTIQRLNPFEATVNFELSRPQAGWLLYQPAEEDGKSWWSIPFDDQQTMHQIPLVGLTPGAGYRVQLGLGESLQSLSVPDLFGTAWGPLRFMTPEIGEPDLRFAVLGDSGFGDERTRDLIDVMLSYDLDFVLHTGDVVYNVYEEPGPPEAFAKKYFHMFAPLLMQIPVFPVMGNHEFDAAARFNGEPFFIRAFPALTDASVPDLALGTWYAMEFSKIQFLMLDSAVFHGAGGRAEQTAWLKERLADPNYRISIAVYHTPPFTSGLHSNDGAAIRANWIPLFESAEVPITFSGHDHNYERIERNGVTYVVSGGGSAVLYRKSKAVEGSQVFHRRMHFVLVEITEDDLILTAIDLTGEELDHVRIDLNPPQ